MSSKKHPLPISLLLLLFLFSYSHSRDDIVTPTDGEIVPPVLKTSLVAPIPNELKHLHINQPFVDYQVLVDENGITKDHIAIASNHFGLLHSANQVVETALFKPALLNGIPTPIQLEIRVTFSDYDQELWRETGRLPMGANVMDGADRKIYDRNKDRYLYSQSDPEALDSPIQLLDGSLVVLENTKGEKPSGSCVVEFFINHKGNVKLPRIQSSDNDAVSMSSLASLEGFTYSEPKSKGKPTFIKVQQRFNYN